MFIKILPKCRVFVGGCLHVVDEEVITRERKYNVDAASVVEVNHIRYICES